MQTDVKSLMKSIELFNSSYDMLGDCGSLLNLAISDASVVSDDTYSTRLTNVKNNILSITNELDDAIEYINKTIIMINAFDSSGNDYDLSLLSLDSLKENSYLYFIDNIISSDNLSNTKKNNPNAEKNILYIYSFMRNNLGYTHDGAMAMINNMGAESAFDPTAKNSNSGAFGLCQWLDRKKDLIKYANDNNLDVNDIDTQLLFMDHELQTRFNSGNEQHHLYDQVTGKVDVDARSLSGNITKIYEQPVDYNESNWYEKLQNISDNRYYSYNKVVEDFLDNNNIFSRNDTGNINLNYNGLNVHDNNRKSVDNNSHLNNDTTLKDRDLEVLNLSNNSNNINEPPFNKIYVVKKGDSLYSVFGDKWRDVYNANKDKIGSDSGNIYEGMELVIPYSSENKAETI